MSTSGTITYSLTARQVASFALSKLGVVASTATPAAEDMATAVKGLNLMLKTWAMTGPSLHRMTFGSVALVASQASYTLTPRPYRVHECRYRYASGLDLPMEEMTREAYVEIPLKTSTGIPVSYYVDKQRTATTLYVWPVPSTVTTETVQYSYDRVFEDVATYDDDLDIPQEWLETVGFNLAERLLAEFPTDSANIIRQQAAELKQLALDSDRETEVRFIPDRRR